MEFKKNQTIYLQIADHICENILTQTWAIGEKIPSVREMAANIEVNPNTIMRTYTHLQEASIIQNKRGIGYFVVPEARERIIELHKKEFVTEVLPEVIKKMTLLGVSKEEFTQLYDTAITQPKNQ